jgi:hypothetical protein
MVIPQGLNTRLQRDITDIVARLYEDVTVDNEDCKTLSLMHVSH